MRRMTRESFLAVYFTVIAVLIFTVVFAIRVIVKIMLWIEILHISLLLPACLLTHNSFSLFDFSHTQLHYR